MLFVLSERNPMPLVPIKTASETGYCDCVCGCYELASLRDEDTGKGYCPACGKDHLDWNLGVGRILPLANPPVNCLLPPIRLPGSADGIASFVAAAL